MYTRAFNKLPPAILAVGFAVVSYAVLFLALNQLANWAEANQNAYPYEAGDDPIRLLLPSLVGRPGRARLMLIGPSAAEEGLLYEEFERAFPGYSAYQASFSTATFDDVLLVLDYIKRAYGTEVLPKLLVVGGEARFFANLPRRFGRNADPTAFSPLFTMINAYSPLFRVKATEDESILVAKTTRESITSRLRFWLVKQQPRHRAALATLFRLMVTRNALDIGSTTNLPPLNDVRDPFARSSAGTAMRYVVEVGPRRALAAWLSAYVSPYNAHFRPAQRPDTRPKAMAGIRWWNPDSERELIKSQARRLREIAAQLNMKVVVVVLPEHPLSRALQPQQYYDSLITLLREGLSDIPFLELRTLLGPDEFFDAVHVKRPGAERVSAEVIKFTQSRQLLD